MILLRSIPIRLTELSSLNDRVTFSELIIIPSRHYTRVYNTYLLQTRARKSFRVSIRRNAIGIIPIDSRRRRIALNKNCLLLWQTLTAVIV